MKFRAVGIATLAVLAGCASVQGQSGSSTGGFENYSTSNNSEADFFYSETYFSKEGGDFAGDFGACHQSSLEYIQENGKGYQVMRSLGRSDQEIISNNVIDCLFVNDWQASVEEGGTLQELGFGHGMMKTKASMSEEELAKSAKDLAARKEWYKKYDPDLLR